MTQLPLSLASALSSSPPSTLPSCGHVPHASSGTSALPPAPAPEPCGVPAFPPLRVRGGLHWQRTRLRRVLRRRRRALAAGLAVTAAALAAWVPRAQVGTDARGEPVALPRHAPPRPAPPPPVDIVSAPVRIADAETVRLLEPGDRVDVIAASGSPAGTGFGAAYGRGSGPREGSRTDSDARVIATGARVADVPRASEGPQEGGALVVLAVPRPVAAALAGASTTSRLAVTLC
ncbi:RcpC/CpaB family pilus assembly protein [Streptomyces sp. NBC_00259]|nr:hypothetical protein [Streptomyces sp. NBC_00259]